MTYGLDALSRLGDLGQRLPSLFLWVKSFRGVRGLLHGILEVGLSCIPLSSGIAVRWLLRREMSCYLWACFGLLMVVVMFPSDVDVDGMIVKSLGKGNHERF